VYERKNKDPVQTTHETNVYGGRGRELLDLQRPRVVSRSTGEKVHSQGTDEFLAKTNLIMASIRNKDKEGSGCGLATTNWLGPLSKGSSSFTEGKQGLPDDSIRGDRQRSPLRQDYGFGTRAFFPGLYRFGGMESLLPYGAQNELAVGINGIYEDRDHNSGLFSTHG